MIEYYLDAKREGDEFEFWGLKMVVCMEFLCGQHFKHSSENCILEPNCFKKIKNKIIPQLKQVLEDMADGIQQDQIDAICAKVSELNRDSFKSTLLKMNQETGARISKEAVKRFVKIRNALVHKGEYDLGYGTAYQQYGFLDKYIYYFLLSVLGQPADSVWAGYTWKSDGTPINDTLKHALIL